MYLEAVEKHEVQIREGRKKVKEAVAAVYSGHRTA
jgi:hypothetical protein